MGIPYPEARSLTPSILLRRCRTGAEMTKGLAGKAANPSFLMVAGARNAECYTAPEVYWVDLC